jgi:hypothetical protein
LVVVALLTVHVWGGSSTWTLPLPPTTATTLIRGVVKVAGQSVPIVQVVYPAPFQYESVPLAVAVGFAPPTPDSADVESVKFVTWISEPFQPAGPGTVAGKPPNVNVPIERVASAWMHPSPEVPAHVPGCGVTSRFVKP